MELLRVAYERLGEIEDEILKELEIFEEVTVEHLKNTRKQLENSPIKNIELKLNENFHKIESFGNRLKTVADESDCALNGLKKGVNIVETVSILYNSASKAVEQLNNDNTSDGFEEIEKYIKAVDSAKVNGHWEDVNKVISKGYINQVISTLRLVALDLLKTKLTSEHSKLLTRLAVALNAEREAYESYLSSVKLESERKVVSNLLTTAGGEVACLTRVIQNARNLLVRQANSVFTELGAIYYIEIAREIHSYASSEACKIFVDFVKLNFGQFLGYPDANESLVNVNNYSYNSETDKGRRDNRDSSRENTGNQFKRDDGTTLVDSRDNKDNTRMDKDSKSKVDTDGRYEHGVKDSEDGNVITKLEKVLKNTTVVESIVSDVKYQKLLDTIAVMASLWTDFETALRESTRPVYSNLLVKADVDEYGSDGLVFLSEATKKLQSILAIYVQLQHAFVLKSVVQAIQISDTIYISQEDNTLTSTLVDDVFFILQKSQQRSIGTGDIQTACATFNQISGIISNELKTALMDNLVQSQPTYERWAQKLENVTNGTLYNMLEEYFKRTRGNIPDVISSKYSFVHSLNNLEECLGLLSKFKQEMAECFNDEFLKDNQDNGLLVDNTIQALDLVNSELEQIMETCCNYVTNMFKEHISDPLNKFSLINFEMDEETYSTIQNEDSFVDVLVGVLQVILKHIETNYASKVGSKCMNSLVEKMCKFLEACTLGKRFTIYGAVYFDGVVRALVYSCSSYGYDLKKQFSTLLQISDVLNVNNNDDLMLLKESEYTIDVTKYSSLRTDLNF